MKIEEFLARYRFYGGSPDEARPTSPEVKLLLVRDLRKDGYSLIEARSILERVSLAHQLAPNTRTFFVWVDRRFQVQSMSDTSSYCWRYGSTIHFNLTNNQEGFVRVKSQRGAFVFGVHDFGTDSQTREIWVLDQLIYTLPCSFGPDTTMRELAASPPPTEVMSDEQYFRRMSAFGKTVVRLDSDEIALTFDQKWRFSRERCG